MRDREPQAWQRNTRKEFSAGKAIAAASLLVAAIMAIRAAKGDAPFYGLSGSSSDTPEKPSTADLMGDQFRNAQRVEVKVNNPDGGSIKFRNSPIVANQSADNKIGEIPNGTPLEVIPVKGRRSNAEEVWGKTEYKGKVGYVFENYVQRESDGQTGLRDPKITIYDPETGKQALWNLPR